MYTIVYITKSGRKQAGRAGDAAQVVEKIRLYSAAGVTQFTITDHDGRSIRLDDLPALADLGH
ncbi:MAG: hypothetical protein EOP62_19595 [Sphingomonadales bacterium]|nr:MAG: hypothetical protein EOP62_19595 [Sphingomonadales bacterium]